MSLAVNEIKYNNAGQEVILPIQAAPGESVSTNVVDFVPAETREDLAPKSPLSKLFSQVAKWLSDLKAVAFSGSYNDLLDRPDVDGLQTQINEIKRSFPDGCEQIAAAVTSMGVTTAANAAVATIVSNIKKIVTKINGTATPAQVLAGATFYSADAKAKQTGTMPAHNTWTATISPGDTIQIPDGCHSGSSVTARGGTQHKQLEVWGAPTDSHSSATDILDNSAGVITALRLVSLKLNNKKYVPDSGSGSQTPTGTLVIRNNTTDVILFEEAITNTASHGSGSDVPSLVTADLNNQLVDVSQCTSIKVTLDFKCGYAQGSVTVDYYTQQ